ncbi:hypothetical protein RZS08_67465, partial [Arthrospira platensis SPKY1]|nr:hypothetical protein [Arthrospira platensis SPKY1]
EITANIPTYAVFRHPATGNHTCAAYNGASTPRLVTFSNGAVLYLAPRALVSTPVGGCVAMTYHYQYLPVMLR